MTKWCLDFSERISDVLNEQTRGRPSLIKRQAADIYDSGIQKLVPRLNKSWDNAGEYVEK
jgi:hypothetical protein